MGQAGKSVEFVKVEVLMVENVSSLVRSMVSSNFRIMDWPRALVIIERFERMAKINLRELQLLHRSIVDVSLLF